MGIVADLVALDPTVRMLWYGEQPIEAQAQILSAFRDEQGTPWGMWADDPVGFVRGPLGEYVWSMQTKLLEAIRDNRRVDVPACHAPGKSHSVARAVAWWIATHPPGTAVAVTTAPTRRQVRAIIWPHIRRMHALHNLPGVCHQMEWQIGTDIVAYGFSPAKWDDTGAQGIHAQHVLVVIDEAGGIPAALGESLNAILTSEHSRIVAVGNPPVDEEGTWFEGLQEHRQWHTLRVPASTTPNFTAEGAVVPDIILQSLLSKQWVDDAIEAYGVESNYYKAKVLALFPRGSANKAIPADWIDRCLPMDVSLEDGTMVPKREQGMGGWQRLGVDVASDGGDEFVIAHLNGQRLKIVHASQGADNANQVDVAERVLEQILHCERIQEVEGFTARKVRVKVDAIGIGQGASDILKKWSQEQVDLDTGTIRDRPRHNSDIVALNSSERATEPTLYHNRRAEAWWHMRETVRMLDVVLELDKREQAQLNGPKWFEDAGGRVQIEKKADMKKRGLSSPDRADACVYAEYEPEFVGIAETSSPAVVGSGRSIPRVPRNQWS